MGSPSLIRKVDALKKLHEKITDINVDYKQERIALEVKYRELKKPIYADQSKIISGEVDVPAEEGPEASSEDVDADEHVKGIPGYWAQALLNHPSIQEIVTEEDLPALDALTDLTCEYNADYTAFTITFYFDENDYFTNETLSKTYTVTPDLFDDNAPSLGDHETSTIEWKAGDISLNSDHPDPDPDFT